MNPSSIFSAPDKFGPASEHVIRRFYETLVRPGERVVDIGVHYGIHLFPLSNAVGDNGVVYAFEANKDRFVSLSQEIVNQAFHNIRLSSSAVFSRQETIKFFVHPANTGRSGLSPNPEPDETVEFEERIVCADKLDMMIPGSERISFIKMDIEGWEFSALLGAQDTIQRGRPVIIFEGSLEQSAQKENLPPDAPWIFAKNNNYCILNLFGSILSTGDHWGPGWNFVLCPNEKLESHNIHQALSDSWVAME